MNKHTVIVIIASVIIIATVGYSVWNAFAVNNLQIASFEQGRFAYFDLMNDGTISMCNPLPFPVNVDRIDITIFHNDEIKGTFSTYPTTISPQSSSLVDGDFRSDLFVDAQYLFLHMDGQFSGATLVRIDPRTMFVVTEIQTPLIGVIPYSVTKQYTGSDFYNMMKDRTEFLC